jgi:hypothetical protein
MLGMGNSVPVIMELNPVNGEVLKFLSLDKIGSTSTNFPWFKTYGAIYHDIKDVNDGLPYYYASFIMEDALILIKINSNTLNIKYTFYKLITTGATAGDEWKNKKVPGMFLADKKDSSRMLLFGQYGGTAAVIKFDKKTAIVDWKLEFKDHNITNVAPKSDMAEIYSVVQADDDTEWFYGCGYKWVDPTQEKEKNAVTFKMSMDGDIQFLDVWAAATETSKDTCRSVAYDKTNGDVKFMLEVTSADLRPNYNSYYRYSSLNNDVLIVTMRPGGDYLKAINLNYDDASINFGVGTNSFFIHEEEYVFGGQSWGYKTKLQNVTYNLVTPTLDSHLFKFKPDGKANCFFQNDFG